MDDIIVLKFGGSSVADNEKLKIVADKITNMYDKNNNIVVILSAQGKMTDKLIGEAKELAKDVEKREMDALVSCGVQMAAAKLSILLNSLGYNAISLTGWQAGIYTNNTNQNAIIQNINTERILKELKQKNSELEQSLRELEIIKAENATLKEQMNLREKYGEYQTVSGYVINRDISNYTGMVVINVGSNDGVKPNMTVIADKGLVGNVVSVTENTAKVQTIVDPASSVSCIINTSKDAFITKGSINSGREIKATYIPTDAVLVQDTSVETSGLGGIYPKGIHVGTIKEVVNTQNPTDKYAIIETAVDFSKLDTVLVILN